MLAKLYSYFSTTKCGYPKFNNTETYYLVIADEAGVQIPVKEEMQIDIAMAIDEFDFFS